jgi:tRNA/rRNA methyltransferase/tRNA (cytidine32/uridine32-2'-O)-methyltransferase
MQELSLPAALDNIVVILFEPQDVVNVGAVIRVMSNFGLKRLRLVEPAAWDAYRVEGIAHHTRPLIDAVEFYPTLAAALADCGFVLGTTARKRGTRRERLTPRQAAPLMLEAATKSPGTPAALLFGREDTGLPNEALDDCHALLTIPTGATNPSLNLAQAALVVMYELFLATQAGEEPASVPAVEPPAPPLATEPEPRGVPPRRGEPASVVQAIELLQQDARLATGTEREQMFKALADLLWKLYPNTTEERVAYSLTRLRAVLLRAAPRHDESRAIAHLFHHLIQVVSQDKPAKVGE